VGRGLGWPGAEYAVIRDLMRFSTCSQYNYWEYNALGRLPEKIPRFHWFELPLRLRRHAAQSSALSRGGVGDESDETMDNESWSAARGRFGQRGRVKQDNSCGLQRELIISYHMFGSSCQNGVTC
jgi:hypothetical protein